MRKQCVDCQRSSSNSSVGVCFGEKPLGKGDYETSSANFNSLTEEKFAESAATASSLLRGLRSLSLLYI